MKQRIIAILLLTVLCLSLSACGSPEKTSSGSAAEPAQMQESVPASPEPEETAAPDSRPPFVSVLVEREAETCTEDGTVLLNYAADRPRVEIPEHPGAADAVNETLEADLLRFRDGDDAEDYISGKEDCLAAAREDLTYRRKEGNKDSFVPYLLQSDCLTARVDERVISIITDESTYFGGVHGYVGRSARNFDARTGKVLQLEDLFNDPQDFLERCPELLWFAGRGGENAYLALTESYFDGYEEDLPGLLRDGNWYLNDRGLVVIANPYEIGPYVMGRVEFTLSYDWLRWEMKEEYLPHEYTPEGMIAGEILSQAAEADIYLDDGTEGQGACVFFSAEGDVGNVRLTRVSYNEWSNTFTEDSLLWAASDLPAGAAVLLRTWIGDVLPTLKLSYTSGGQNREYYISQSGKDGSLVLLDGRQFLSLPMEITDLLPLSFDVDGDSVPEVIDLTDSGEEYYRLLTVDGELLGEVFSIDPQTQHLWLTDLDGDGMAELLYCADMGSEDYVTSAWRADTAEPIRFTMETRGGKDGREVTDTVNGRIAFSYGWLFLESYTYQLGTYASVRPYELLDGSVIAPKTTECPWAAAWVFSYNRTYLDLTREIPVTMDDTGEGTLPAEAQILLLGSDGTRMRFRTRDGLTGTIMTEYRGGPDGGWFINGVRDTDCFKMLPYAG